MVSDAPSSPSPAEPGSPGLDAADGRPPILEQAFDEGSLYALREATAAHAAHAGLSEGRVTDLVLAVHELAANAVRHGAGHGRLRVWQTGDALRCEVTDGGAAQETDGGAAGDTATRGTADTDAPLWPIERGHGLWLVRQVADQASLDVGPLGTAAIVSFTLGAPGALAPFRLTQRTQDRCTVVTVTGQLDLGSAGQFATAVGDLITASQGLYLILDLAGLTSWDSSGLAALLTAQQWISADPAARMILAAMPGHLAKRLHDAGLARRFTLAADTGAALSMFMPPPTGES